MSFVTTEEFQREGRSVNSEVVSLDEAVDRTMKGDHIFPDGPWWQRWKGFRGAWSQYYEEQVKPTPILPFHDDGDIQQWSKDLATWKADFARGQLANAARQLAGPLAGPPLPSSSSSSSAVKALAVLAALGIGGYFLSSVGNVKRAFS